MKLSINNVSLQTPGTLQLQLIPPPATPDAPLSRLRVTAGWPGLDSAGIAGILGPTGAPFTLACLDPVTGAIRGFPARLKDVRVTDLGAELHALQAMFEEID